LKSTRRRFPVGIQRHLQIALDLRLESGSLNRTQLETNPKIELHIDIVNPRTLLRIVRGNIIHHNMLPLERHIQLRGVLLPLVKRRQRIDGETLAAVKRPGLDTVVVDPDVLVRVSDGEIQIQIVVEIGAGGVGGVEVELGEGGVGDVELDPGRAEGEPEEEEDEAGGEEHGEEDLEEAVEDAAAEAAQGVAAASASWAVVGFRRRWD